jgi:hypothetical protein
LYGWLDGGSDCRPSSGEPWALYDRTGDPADKFCPSGALDVLLEYMLRSGDGWRRNGAKSERGPGKPRRGDGGCML